MALVMFDFRCNNPECGEVVELLIDRGSANDPQICPACGGGETGQPTLERCVSAVSFWTNDTARTHDQLRVRSKEHTQKIWKGEADPHEHPDSFSADPVWRNKTRPKNTSLTTIEQHKNDHVGYSDEPSRPGALQVGKLPGDLK